MIITSPLLIPAFDAEEFGFTPLTRAPRSFLSPRAFCNSAVTGWVVTPNQPLVILPYLIRSSVAFLTTLIGIAMLTPELPAGCFGGIVLIPTTSPLRFTSGPP